MKYFLLLFILLNFYSFCESACLLEEVNTETNISLIADEVSVELKCHQPGALKTAANSELILNDTLYPHYITQMFFKGFPEEKEINLLLRRPLFEENYKQRFAFVLLKDGQCKMKFAKQSKKDPNFIWFCSGGYLPGERLECRFASVDGSFIYDFFFIPHPAVVSHPTSQLKVEAELIGAFETIYRLKISGMEEGEKFRQISSSGNEVLEVTCIYPNYVTIYMPGVIGSQGGVAKLIFKRLVNNEVLTIKLPWGMDLVKYAEGSLVFFPTGAKTALPPKL